MRMSFPLLAACVLFVAGVAAAAEPSPSPTPSPTPSPAPQRPLLQPPVRQVPSPITDRFMVRAVYFRPSISTIGRYDGTTGASGTRFSGEDTIGLADTRNQAWIDIGFRMTERHRITAQYYELRRSGRTTLGQPLEFGDDTFLSTDGVIRSGMDLRQLNIGYLYSVLRRQRIELGLGLGVHLMQLDGTVEAPASFKRQHLDTAGPYPTLDGDLSWRFTRRFSLNGAAHYFTYVARRTDGNSLAWNADLQFRAARNLAVGAGYASTRYRLSSSDPDFFQGYLRLRYQGPELFLRASF